MEPISFGISLSAAAHHVLAKLDWEKAASNYAKEGVGTLGKSLWKRLRPSEKDKAAKLAVGMFVEQFMSELEDKTPFSSALPGYQEQLKKLSESAFYEISQWMLPEVEDVDLEPVRRLWDSLGLDPLPPGFDWDFVSKNFARSIRKAVKADASLREGLSIALQEEIAENAARTATAVERMVGPAVGFDLVGYRSFLSNTCAGLQLALLQPSTYAYDRQVSLWSVFVPQSARSSIPISPWVHVDSTSTSGESYSADYEESDLSGESIDETDVSSILEIVDRERLLVILGDPGSGKTSLLNYRALQWINEGTGPLPLRVDLKQYVQQQIGIVGWLESGCSSYRLDASEIDAQLQSGEAALHLDGLDEIFDLSSRRTVLQEIVALSSRYPRAPIIVTSRVLGYEPDTLRNAGFTHATLEELDAVQINEFLRLWHLVAENNQQERDRLRSRLQIGIRDSRPIQELSGNPLLLTMMAILNRIQPLPRNRVELYREASRVLVHEWDTRRLLPDETLDQQDKIKLLRNLAGAMQDNAHSLNGNLIGRDALVSVFRQFLKELGVSDPYEAAKSLVVQLTERNFILCYAGSEYFSFVHRTFLEFFCALWFVYQFQVDQTLSFADLRDQVFGGHWRDETWHEVLCLIAGMVGEKYAEQLLLFLMKQDGLTEMQMNLRLAAQCLGEVRARHQLEATDSQLRQRLRDEVVRCEPAYYCTEDEEREKCGPVREHAIALLSAVWRDDDTRSWLREIIDSDRDRIIRQAAVRELARNWADDEATHASLLKDLRTSKHWDVRKASIRELVRGWKEDIQTHAFLLDRAYSDKDWDVRQIAIEELARNWPEDPRTLPLLLDSARNDHDWMVRQSALRELTQGWRDHPQIQALLINIVHNDPNRIAKKAALQELARGWRHEPAIRSLLIDQISDGQYLETRRTSVEELVRGWGDSEDVHSMVIKLARESKNGDVRQAALQQLARRWPHDQKTHSLLFERSQYDKDWVVRAAALQELSHWWRDEPETHWLLLSCAHNGEWFIRSTALQILARVWRDDPQTFTLILDRAQNDKLGDVRQAALQQLARGWKDRIEIHPLILGASQHDTVRTVRQLAIRELARGWRNSPETGKILKDRAQNDGDSAVRQAAVRELARGWKYDREVFSLLFDRVRNDAEGEVRLAALQELSRGWSTNPKTHELLNLHASKDESHLVRRTALRELARNWSADSFTHPLVRQLAMSDPPWKVRQAALQELTRGWSDDPSTYGFLIDRIRQDDQGEVRQTAVREVARGWRDAPDLHRLLQEVLHTDENAGVRKTVGMELERGWQKVV